MKEMYESPILDVIVYETEDVITTSYGDNDFKDPWGKV
jgi:hypothetical protein